MGGVGGGGRRGGGKKQEVSLRRQRPFKKKSSRRRLLSRRWFFVSMECSFARSLSLRGAHCFPLPTTMNVIREYRSVALVQVSACETAQSVRQTSLRRLASIGRRWRRRLCLLLKIISAHLPKLRELKLQLFQGLVSSDVLRGVAGLALYIGIAGVGREKGREEGS